jgi:hypothetical protein
VNDCDEARRRYGITTPCCPNCHSDTLPDSVEINGEQWVVCCHIAGELKKRASK